MPKCVDQFENQTAKVVFGSTTPDANFYMGLYTNGSEPLESATLANITEVTGTSYARKTLPRGDWTVTASIASFAEQTFTAGSDWGNVTGFFIATSSNNSGLLCFVESFSGGAYNITNGTSLKITPKIAVA